MRVRNRGLHAVCLAMITAAFFQACTPEPVTGSPGAAPVPAPDIPAGGPSPGPAPAPVPTVPGDDSLPPTAAPVVFTDATLAQIQRDMTPEAVRAVTGSAGTAIGGDGGDVHVVRYEDGAGNHFTVRYDGGVVRTHSSLRSAQVPAPSAPAPQQRTPPAEAGDRPVAEIAPGVFIPLERAVAAANGQPRGTASAPLPAPAVPHDEVPVRWTTPGAPEASPPTPPGPAVVVAGSARGTREGGEDAESAYRPRARLPEFSRSLREGRYEIRFVNPSDSPVSVGLRQGDEGQNVEVPAAGQASMQVDRGSYDLYFIRDSESYTLYEANSLAIDGLRVTDVQVTLNPQDVQVRPIDYSTPRPP